MDQALIKILQAASSNPDYKTIANYLMSRRAMPELGYMSGPSSNYGTFTTPSLFSGSAVPQRGIVQVPANAATTAPEQLSPTILHEFTHAAQNQLYQQYQEIKNKKDKTEADKQFMSNFDKIMGANPTEQISKFDPEFAKNKADYRARGDEALSFAIENSNFPNSSTSWKAPQHVDPTLTTQLMLLLDQAQKLQDSLPPKGR